MRSDIVSRLRQIAAGIDGTGTAKDLLALAQEVEDDSGLGTVAEFIGGRVVSDDGEEPYAMREMPAPLGPTYLVVKRGGLSLYSEDGWDNGDPDLADVTF